MGTGCVRSYKATRVSSHWWCRWWCRCHLACTQLDKFELIALDLISDCWPLMVHRMGSIPPKTEHLQLIFLCWNYLLVAVDASGFLSRYRLVTILSALSFVCAPKMVCLCVSANDVSSRPHFVFGYRVWAYSMVSGLSLLLPFHLHAQNRISARYCVTNSNMNTDDRPHQYHRSRHLLYIYLMETIVL